MKKGCFLRIAIYLSLVECYLYIDFDSIYRSSTHQANEKLKTFSFHITYMVNTKYIMLKKNVIESMAHYKNVIHKIDN